MSTRNFLLSLLGLLILLIHVQMPAQEIRRRTTENGVAFGTWGNLRDPLPAPVLFILGNTIEGVLGNEYFRQAGDRLGREHGWLCVSLDLPFHGQYAKAGKAQEIEGWAAAARRKEDFVAENNGRMKDILDYLIKKGLADPDRVFVCGTSRGGYLAYQFAAAEPRVKAAAGFAPVTDLLALREFRGLNREDLLPAFLLENQVTRLARKAIWIAIGDRDERVGTDHAIAFARSLSKAGESDPPQQGVELNVMSSRGHTTPSGAPGRAVEWLLNQ